MLKIFKQKKERGVAQILVLLLLLVGVVGGVYIVNQGTNSLTEAKSRSPFKSSIKCEVSRLSDFTVGKPCSDVPNGFKFAKYSCIDEKGHSIPGFGSIVSTNECKTLEEWSQVAEVKCQNACNQNPVPVTPKPSPTPAFECREDSDCGDNGVCQTLCWDGIDETGHPTGGCSSRCHHLPPVSPTPHPITTCYSDQDCHSNELCNRPVCSLPLVCNPSDPSYDSEECSHWVCPPMQGICQAITPQPSIAPTNPH